jgi:hypothetical protein
MVLLPLSQVLQKFGIMGYQITAIKLTIAFLIWIVWHYTQLFLLLFLVLEQTYLVCLGNGIFTVHFLALGIYDFQKNYQFYYFATAVDFCWVADNSFSFFSSIKYLSAQSTPANLFEFKGPKNG